MRPVAAVEAPALGLACCVPPLPPSREPSSFMCVRLGVCAEITVELTITNTELKHCSRERDEKRT